MAGNDLTALEQDLSIAPTSMPPGAEQSPGSPRLATNDDSFTSVAVSNGIVWVVGNDACFLDTTARACVRAIQISIVGMPAIIQDVDLGQAALRGAERDRLELVDAVAEEPDAPSDRSGKRRDLLGEEPDVPGHERTQPALDVHEDALVGLGGGVLIVPLLTLVFRLPITFAIGASIISVIATRGTPHVTHGRRAGVSRGYGTE